MVVSTYALHRSPERWPDPDTFDPERFSPERVKQRSRFAYVPFGVGPRQCIGSMLASLELQVIVAAVVGSFHLEFADGCDVTPEARMTLRPRGPLLMRLREVRGSEAVLSPAMRLMKQMSRQARRVVDHAPDLETSFRSSF